MAWLAVDLDGKEHIFANKPYRELSSPFGSCWETSWLGSKIELPKGSIKKLTGRNLSWEDEPVELEVE